MTAQKHTLAYIKRLAKKFRKERGISHHEALDKVSISLGYANWMHCHRSLGEQYNNTVERTKEPEDIIFTNWLKRHAKRNSPLGDLATDMINDLSWPSHGSMEDYRSYLRGRGAIPEAVVALVRAWKSYKAYLKRTKTPKVNKGTAKKALRANLDQRKIVYIKDVTPIAYPKRTVESFAPGDKAWISWDGRKAIPVTVTKVDDTHCSFTVERPIKKAGSQHYLYLDEVRSTPELACRNHVTW